jgi:hypothetical protein
MYIDSMSEKKKLLVERRWAESIRRAGKSPAAAESRSVWVFELKFQRWCGEKNMAASNPMNVEYTVRYIARPMPELLIKYFWLNIRSIYTYLFLFYFSLPSYKYILLLLLFGWWWWWWWGGGGCCLGGVAPDNPDMMAS